MTRELTQSLWPFIVFMHLKVSLFHISIVLSHDPDTIFPFCIIARQRAHSLLKLIVFKHSKVSLSHIFIVISPDPVTIFPFCIIARHLTESLWPLIVFKHLKVSLSQILIVLSADPETIFPFYRNRLDYKSFLSGYPTNMFTLSIDFALHLFSFNLADGSDFNKSHLANTKTLFMVRIERIEKMKFKKRLIDH
ncbi:hypothetical protein BpHYR1_042557 [Brachionus plicatilis]|uniref:Uncharacterized protein n=1 Tax=Brachionus plicatilis TaxID=10195 RepID=A0A3M7RRE4_BRAPC|nr:hypothetical protein BpHYR1_042557 [Brachionus plicatilis]